jgi:hypothetical protein
LWQVRKGFVLSTHRRVKGFGCEVKGLELVADGGMPPGLSDVSGGSAIQSRDHCLDVDPQSAADRAYGAEVHDLAAKPPAATAVHVGFMDQSFDVAYRDTKGQGCLLDRQQIGPIASGGAGLNLAGHQCLKSVDMLNPSDAE